MRTTLRLALLALVMSKATFAHEGDPKLLDYKGAVTGPAWLADQQPEGDKAASPFRSSGVRLMAWFPVASFKADNTSGSDAWGYVSPSGREYALMGLSNGTGFVEVTNPGSSRIIAFISGPPSLWRNVKTYQNYAYSVSEAGGGMQVFNEAQPDDDHSTTGTKCWLTGNGPPGRAAFSPDLDGGTTTLTSLAWMAVTSRCSCCS
ncbi:MAG: hypothetical protein FJ292_01750 [Planctomycetes bacterium]|nr:hypothetical protein [Planctomycetota bacterium]